MMTLLIFLLACTTVTTDTRDASNRPDCSPAARIICSSFGTQRSRPSDKDRPFCTVRRQSSRMIASGSCGFLPCSEARYCSSSRIFSSGKPLASILAILRYSRSRTVSENWVRAHKRLISSSTAALHYMQERPHLRHSKMEMSNHLLGHARINHAFSDLGNRMIEHGAATQFAQPVIDCQGFLTEPHITEELVIRNDDLGHYSTADGAVMIAARTTLAEHTNPLQRGRHHLPHTRQHGCRQFLRMRGQRQATIRTQGLDQALTNQSSDHCMIGRQIQWQTQIDQPIHDRQRTVGMYRGPDLVAGHRGAQGILCGGTVTYLTDHDGVRIEPHGIRDRCRKHARTFFFAAGIGHRRLYRPFDRILDRVFNRQHMHLAAGFENLAGEHPLQRGRLARTGRTADDVDADWLLLELLQQVRMLLAEAERSQVSSFSGVVV